MRPKCYTSSQVLGNKCFIFWKEAFRVFSCWAMLSTTLTLEAFMSRHCWVRSWLCKAKYLQYLGLWGRPEGNHMTATQSYTKATGGPWGRDQLFIFSEITIWSALKEQKVHVGNNANKKYVWSMKWNYEVLVLEWAHTRGLAAQGWNFEEEDEMLFSRMRFSFTPY